MRQLVAAALLTICLASLAPGAASAPGASPLASNEPFTFTLRPSRIIVRIPDTSLRPVADPNGRPNYFKVEGHNPVLIVSGWIEPDVGYKGLDAFWKGESASPAFAPPFAPIRVEMLREGRWEIVAYAALRAAGRAPRN